MCFYQHKFAEDIHSCVHQVCSSLSLFLFVCLFSFLFWELMWCLSHRRILGGFFLLSSFKLLEKTLGWVLEKFCRVQLWRHLIRSFLVVRVYITISMCILFVDLFNFSMWLQLNIGKLNVSGNLFVFSGFSSLLTYSYLY